VDRVEESDRGWMMLFLVFGPKLTGKKADTGSEYIVKFPAVTFQCTASNNLIYFCCVRFQKFKELACDVRQPTHCEIKINFIVLLILSSRSFLDPNFTLSAVRMPDSNIMLEKTGGVKN